MTDFVNVKIPASLAGMIDALKERGDCFTRASFVQQTLMREFRARGMLKVDAEKRDTPDRPYPKTVEGKGFRLTYDPEVTRADLNPVEDLPALVVVLTFRE